jgi:hypothetical protein
VRILGPVESEPITVLNDGDITYRGAGRIDDDGLGPSDGDPYHQNTTSLKQNGKSLNGNSDKYIVVPPAILYGIKAIILGCQAYVINTLNGMNTEAVVADIGPPDKIGEMSVACAEALGINPNPVSGGENSHVIHYHIIPGARATVDGREYSLQPV